MYLKRKLSDKRDFYNFSWLQKLGENKKKWVKKSDIADKKSPDSGSGDAKANRIGAGKFQFCDRPM